MENFIPDGFHIIGDGAYPSNDKLFKPYKGDLTIDQANYNTMLSKQRRKIENAFGLFKNKFRRFRNCFVNGEKSLYIKVFIAGIIFHNILIGD